MGTGLPWLGYVSVPEDKWDSPVAHRCDQEGDFWLPTSPLDGVTRFRLHRAAIPAKGATGTALRHSERPPSLLGAVAYLRWPWPVPYHRLWFVLDGLCPPPTSWASLRERASRSPPFCWATRPWRACRAD